MSKGSVVMLKDGQIRIASEPDGWGNYTTVTALDGMQEKSARLIADVTKAKLLDWRSEAPKERVPCPYCARLRAQGYPAPTCEDCCGSGWIMQSA